MRQIIISIINLLGTIVHLLDYKKLMMAAILTTNKRKMQAKKKKIKRKKPRNPLYRYINEAVFVVLMAVAFFLFLALVSYRESDPGWSHTGMGLGAKNLVGIVGAWFADVLFILFGYLAFFAPVMIAYSGWLVLKSEQANGKLDLSTLGVRWIGFFITLIAGCSIAAMNFSSSHLPGKAGGVLGDAISNLFVTAFNPVGSTLFLIALFIAGFTLFSHISWVWILDSVGGFVLGLYEGGASAVVNWLDDRKGRVARVARATSVNKERKNRPDVVNRNLK